VSVCLSDRHPLLQVPAKTVKRFLALFLASPHHPGYQMVMQWCMPLREAVVTVRASLPALPKGLRTYVQWLKLHKRPKVLAAPYLYINPQSDAKCSQGWGKAVGPALCLCQPCCVA
jgi:hypothetical protein